MPRLILLSTATYVTAITRYTFDDYTYIIYSAKNNRNPTKSCLFYPLEQ